MSYYLVLTLSLELLRHYPAHFALIKFQQQENAVPEGAPRYWAKRLVPPIEFGSMHASTFTSLSCYFLRCFVIDSLTRVQSFYLFCLVLFQMALIPLTMSRYTIATFSNSKLNKYLPLDKALRIHIHLGYTMVSIVFSASIVFFIFFGLSCSEGEQAFCDKFTSEIMITGYCILGLLVSRIHVSSPVLDKYSSIQHISFLSHLTSLSLSSITSFYLLSQLLMAGTAFFRHSVPYELFYGIHFLFLAMHAIAVGKYSHEVGTFLRLSS